MIKSLFSFLLAILLCTNNMYLVAFAYEEGHTHTFACYDSWELNCTEPDHIHNLTCYIGSGVQMCGLSEGETHNHNDEGYECREVSQVLTCDLEEHDHSEDCFAAIYECRSKNSEQEVSGDEPVDSNTEPSEKDQMISDSNADPAGLDPSVSDSDNEQSELESSASEFADLISKAEQEGEYTYKLESSLSGAISKSINVKGNFVLCLNGQTLEVTADESSLNLFTVGDGATLTIYDSAGNGMIKFSGGDNAVSVSDGGTLNIEGGIITTDNRAVFITGSSGKPATLNMNGGSIKGNNANGNGGGICAVNTSTVNINGGTIENNSTKWVNALTPGNGGGIYARDDTVKLTVGGNAKISDNRADGKGGGIYASANALVDIQGTARIINNTDSTNEKKSGSIYGGALVLGQNCIVNGYQEPSVDNDALAVFIKNNQTNGKVTLDKDYNTNIIHTIAKDTSLEIDLNGYTINAELLNNNDNLFSVEGTLIITDSSSEGKGKIILSGGDNVISVNSGGTLNLKGGSFDTAGCVRAIFCAGTVNMSGGTISGNTVANGNGGAILLSGGTVNMSGGTISDNVAKNGGGIYAVNSATSASTVNITGGTISGNTAQNGGGVAIIDSTISVGGNAEIKENSAVEIGGGIYINASDIEVIIQGTAQIVNNSDRTEEKKSGSISCVLANKLIFGPDCVVDGYHEYTYSNDQLVDFIKKNKVDGKVTLDNDYATNVVHTISEDESLEIDLAGHNINAKLENSSDNLFSVNGTLTITDSIGGGKITLSKGDNVISVNSGGTLNLKGGSFDTAGCVRAIFCAGTVNMSGGTISGNTVANGNGGAILSDGGTVNMSGGTISDNHAGGNGGGISAKNSEIIISGTSVIEKNTADGTANAADSYGSGGGIYAGLNSKVEIQGGTISGNTAMGNSRSIISGGGGVYAKELIISGGMIFGNDAKGWGLNGKGGGVNAINLVMIAGTISGNHAHSGGGIYMRAHTVNDYAKIEGHLTLTGGIIGSKSYIEGKSIKAGTASGGNEADYCGGGIFLDYGVSADIGDATGNSNNKLYIIGNLAKDNKLSKEELNNEAIANNRYPHGYGGGGIFVEHPVGDAGFEAGAKLFVYNALITDNTARYGGGIAGCGASSVELFRVMGAAVFGNKIAENISNNLYYPSSFDVYCEGSGSVDSVMLGGYTTTWQGKVDVNHNNQLPHMEKIVFDSGKEDLSDFFLQSDPTAAAMEGVRQLANVFIEGNTCYSGGGGIGGNGLIRLGANPDVCIKKELVYDRTDTALKQLLDEKEFEFKFVDKNNPSLTYDLKLKGSGFVETKIPAGTYIVTEISDSANVNGYIVETTAEIEGNPVDDPPVSQEITITNDLINTGGMITIKFTNMYINPESPKGNVRINKIVTGENTDSEKEFAFTIRLKDKNGAALTGSYDYTSNDKTGVVSDGDTVKLKNHEHILIEFLPVGTQVSVTEAADNKYTATATVDGANYIQGQEISIIQGHTSEVEFINNVKTTPQNPGSPSDSPPGNPPDDPSDKPSEEQPDDPQDDPKDDPKEEPENPQDEPKEDIPDNPPENPSNPPGYLTELPDPNDPNSPDTVTIWDDGVPTTYIKVWDPDEEEFVYLPEDEVPLANMEFPDEEISLTDDMPATGDNSLTALWAVLAIIALAGIISLGVICKKRRDNTKDNI